MYNHISLKHSLKRITHLLWCAAVALLFAACSSHEPDGPPVTPRTVLVYMVATNNLGSSGCDTEDIEEMKQAAQDGHFGKSRLLVYHAPYSGDVQLKEVLADGTIEVIKTYSGGAGTSVSQDRMREVIADMKVAAPAQDYGLVLWSHASGWIVDGVSEQLSNSPMHYSYGIDHGKKMNISSLAAAVKGAGFSFIYFDCCYMGGVEVMYEMRNTADVAIASVCEVALSGMPYHQTLKWLMAPQADPVRAARTTYEYYESQTSQYERSCAISVINLKAVDRLAEATRAVYMEAPQAVPEGYVKHSFGRGTTYSKCYADFAHYIDALCADKPQLKQQWHTALNDAVVYKAQTQYFQSIVDLSVHCGLSTYVQPNNPSEIVNGYTSTSWFLEVADALIK